MNPRFRRLVERLSEKHRRLMRMSPVSVDTAPRHSPKGGVYVFSKNGRVLYVGRTKRPIVQRLKDHVRAAPDCPFAWHLARKATGQTKASYRPDGSRRKLLNDPKFKRAYQQAKEQIRRMEVRYVEETAPLKQALLEIYVGVATKARYNDFDTH